MRIARELSNLVIYCRYSLLAVWTDDWTLLIKLSLSAQVGGVQLRAGQQETVGQPHRDVQLLGVQGGEAVRGRPGQRHVVPSDAGTRHTHRTVE